MRDHEDAFAVVVTQEVCEEVASASHNVHIALAVRKRGVDSLEARRRHLLDRLPVECAVVALAQPRVQMEWYLGAGEGDLSRLCGAAQV